MMTNVKLAMEYAAKMDREALKKRLGQPIEWDRPCPSCCSYYCGGCWKTTTEMEREQREWVGLTDDDIKAIVGRGDPGGIGAYTREMFKKIEDKLREKNT